MPPEEMELNLPDHLPVMTLPNTAFFPQALMPLHIFEPRYRQMLRDVLATDRLFAVAGLDAQRTEDPNQFEPPHRIASVGIVRACQENDDGTSHLLLQGLCRIEILDIVADEPYRRIRVRPLLSEPGASENENALLRRELVRLLAVRTKLSAPAKSGTDIGSIIKSILDPEAYVDIAAFSLCDDTALIQKLLETLDVHRRLELFSRQVRAEIENLKLRKKLQGRLPDDQIPSN